MSRYFRKRMIIAEEGLMIVTEKWVSIHETPCTHLCIEEENLLRFKAALGYSSDKSPSKIAKEHFRARRVHKKCSRFAFETEERAMNNLIYLKLRQLQHLNRNTVFLEYFREHNEELEDHGSCQIVRGSRELVHSHLSFD